MTDQDQAFVESILVSDLWYIQPTDKVSQAMPAYKPYTTDLRDFIAYYQAKVEGGMPVPTAITRALSHMATPAANLLKESSGASVEFKQRTNFALFMNHVKRVFKVETSDMADNPLRSKQWFVKQRAFPQATPRNQQLMVMTSDAFKLALQFSKVLIPADANDRSGFPDAALKLSYTHCRQMGMFGDANDGNARPADFPTDRDRRAMAIGAAMAFHMEAVKTFQLNYVPGSAAQQIQTFLEDSVKSRDTPCNLFNDFVHDLCDSLTAMTTLKGESLAQHYNKTNKNYAVMAVQASGQHNKNNGRGPNKDRKGKGNNKYKRGEKGSGSNPNNGNGNNQGNNSGPPAAKVGAVNSDQPVNDGPVQQQQEASPQHGSAQASSVEFLDFFPAP